MPQLTTIGNGLLGTPGSSGAAPTATGIDPITGVLNSIPGIGAVNSGLAAVGSSIPGAISNAVTSTLFSSRVVSIVLGLILIAGAILLYIGEDLAGAIEAGGKVAAKVGG